MRALLSVLVVLAGLMVAPQRAVAQGWLDQPFDPDPMSREDIATLQAALAFSQDYYGFLDGIWNDDAQAALEAWVKREERTNKPLYRHLERLIMALEDERVKNGWQLFYSEESGTSYLHPFKLLNEVENDTAVEFLSEDEGFSMIVRFDGFNDMKSVHDWFMGKATKDADPFQFDDDRLWITSTSIEGDFIAYARSDKTKGRDWATMSIVIWPDYFPQLNLMAASVTVGGSPATLIWTDGGVIDQVINGETTAAAPPSAEPDPKDQVRRPRAPGTEEEPPAPDLPDTVDVATGPDPEPAPKLGTPAPKPASPDPEPKPEPEPKPDPTPDPPAGGGLGTGPGGAAPIRPPGSGSDPGGGTATPDPGPAPEPPKEKVTGKITSSGTGFYITPTVLVTAAHVVEGCGAVAMIDGTPLEVLATDSSLDVAVLTGATDQGVWLKLSALEVPKLGEAVTALGYPYYTSLDQGLTVTSGNVSALRGIDGSSSRVMITAPVQPGNSGGPLINKKGAVIGVVVSRVDDMAILEETGSLPQNMNFAVPSGPLLTFLAQNRVTRPQGDGSGGDVAGGVPDGLAAAVVPLHCYE